ncbi:MAG: bifunctional DNA-formamidopyrimidine glycosylase/DNA-(apurinic or apyrimidinic site) lyase [Desulfobulbaceae bacterium]|nr:bifunctional DNA-formamidopyrimidine glycosylase/DNA-(apurinic or apyrimidinic site) lyase [Desulfobulbaceae bacterium]
MPELPEVEVIRQGLIVHVLEKEITAISSSGKKLRLPVPRSELFKWVKWRNIVSVDRRGKYLLFSFDNHAVMIVHLGMTGKLGVFPAAAPPALHDHLVFTFNDGTQMRYNDIRRFGFVRVLSPAEFAAGDPFASLGPEPLDEKFTGAILKKKAGRRLQPVKNFLLDSRMVAGIGNIYANEILFYAGLHPATPIGSISLAQWEVIAAKSQEVLWRAIESGGSTISDFVNSSGQKGYFQLELMVYGRSGESCKQCFEKIAKIVMAGRSTFFCPKCQS